MRANSLKDIQETARYTASQRVDDAAAELSPDEDERQFREILKIAPNPYEQGRSNMRASIAGARRMRVDAFGDLIWC